MTDLDLLAVRFPGAAYVVARGKPGPSDHVDVLIAPAALGDTVLGLMHLLRKLR